MVVAAARGGRGHDLEQPERLALAARHLRMATRARPSGPRFRRHGCSKGPGGQKRSFCPRDHHGYWSIYTRCFSTPPTCSYITEGSVRSGFEGLTPLGPENKQVSYTDVAE